MMQTNITIAGIEEAARALTELATSPRARRGRQRALAAGARVARRAARKTTAFIDRSGGLRRSIKVKMPRRGGAVLVAAAPHAALVEFGHGGPHAAPAKPFLEPAALGTRQQAFAAIAERAERELDKLAGLR